jgi:hypothetical protein
MSWTTDMRPHPLVNDFADVRRRKGVDMVEDICPFVILKLELELVPEDEVGQMDKPEGEPTKVPELPT